MTIEERVDKLEASWGKTDPLVRELRDAVTVTAELENRQGKILKDHSLRIVEHDEWLKGHEAAVKRHDESMQKLNERIGDLVSAIGHLITKMPKTEKH